MYGSDGTSSKIDLVSGVVCRTDFSDRARLMIRDGKHDQTNFCSVNSGTTAKTNFEWLRTHLRGILFTKYFHRAASKDLLLNIST